MISRVLGLVRDHFLARFFGTGMISSFWEIAYMFPNMLRNLLAEGVLSQSFIPLYSESLKKSEIQAKKDTGKVIGFLSIFFMIFVSLMIFLFPLILPWYVGKPKEEIQLLILLSQILFGMIGFLSILSIFSGILNTHNIFVIPALVPILLNLVFIFTFLGFVFFLYFYQIPTDTIALGLAFTVLVGSGLICFFLYSYVKHKGWAPQIQFFFLYWKDPTIKKLFKLVLPAVLGASIFQLNQLLDIFLASYFIRIEGAIPALRFAHRLIQLPTGIIGVAISTTILPVLASHIRKNVSPIESGKELIHGIRFSLFLTIPATIGMYLLGPWIIHFLFSGGLWSFQSTIITWWCLQFYIIGIPFYSMNKILTASFYAYQDSKTPVKILFFTVSVNLVLNLLFIPVLEHGGLALSTAVTSILNFVLLFYFFKKKPIEIPYDEFIDFFKKSLFIFFMIFCYLLFLKYFFSFPLEKDLFFLNKNLFNLNLSSFEKSLPTRKDSFVVVFLGISGSILIHFVLSKKLLKKEWTIIEDLVRSKIKKTF